MTEITREYNIGDWLVYPKHGLGKAIDFETQIILKEKVKLIVVYFEHDRMTLRIPIKKLNELGLRAISDKNKMKKAMLALKGKAKIKKTMWAKREKEYREKLESGDPILIAEVLRDLYRGEGDPEQSYSERQLYEKALDRFSKEMVVVHNIDVEEAIKKTEDNLKAS
tara:strand:+ start:15603 stop:16103 length:501 start_codon:yes stop_codon:yes gene_type:complete